MHSTPNAPTFWLVHADRVIPLAEGAHLVGRAARAQLCFPEDPAMSRIHARLDVTPVHVLVEDLCSENGTWINGRRIHGSVVMPSGSILRMGSTELTLHAIGTGRRVAITSPEVPSARAVRAAELMELATDHRVEVTRGLAEAERALREGRTKEGRALLDEYITLLDVATDRVPRSLLRRTATAAMRFAINTRDGSYADWVSSIHRRLRQPMTPDLKLLAQKAAERGARFDLAAFSPDPSSAHQWPVPPGGAVTRVTASTSRPSHS